MEILNEKPGRKIGLILNALFEEVIDEGEKNNEEYLIGRAKELNNLSEAEMTELANKGKEKMEEKNEKKSVWGIILKVIIVVATAIGSAFGVTACI